MRFDILFHFSHGPVHVLETKRLDLPPGAGASDIYQWFYVDDKSLWPLSFQSMSITPQRRFFQEGMIEFDLRSCRGRIFEKDIELTRQETIGPTLRELVAKGLKSK